MSATNHTTYYNLPQFIGTDIPSWEGDWNDTMGLIDSALNSIKRSAEGAKTTADQAEGKADGNTETISSIQKEITTLKKAVQNYDSILDFNPVNTAMAVNNLSNNNMFFVQNTNKTLNRFYMHAYFKDTISNPTMYTYTANSGTETWWEMFTVEDNVFNLNQSSLPNAKNCLTVGICVLTEKDGTNTRGRALRAWFDGATTHFGMCSGAETAVTNVQGRKVIMPSCTVFLSGSVYNPDQPDE